MMKKVLLIALIFCSVEGFSQNLVASTPMELYGDHLFISLSVDDSEPVDFIFDTGDGLAVIDTELMKNLNLKADHKSTKTSAQGSVKGALIEHNKIEIGEVKIDDIELYTTSLNHLERTIGRNIDGIIGYDLLKNYVVELDYEALEMRIYDKDGYAYNGDGQGVPFKLINFIPTVEAAVTLNNGESFTERFFMNTGAGTSMDFNTPFAKKHDVIDKTGDHYSYPVAGIGDDETMHYEGRVKAFSVSDFTFNEMPIGISQAQHGIQHNKKAAGIIGNNVLKRFNLTFDYENSMVYMKPNQYNEVPFAVNASGLNLQYDEEMKRLLIHRVFGESPAEAAGIKVDDVLLEVDGNPVTDYELPEIRSKLKAFDQTVKLKLEQDGAIKNVELKLTELL